MLPQKVLKLRGSEMLFYPWRLSFPQKSILEKVKMQRILKDYKYFLPNYPTELA